MDPKETKETIVVKFVSFALNGPAKRKMNRRFRREFCLLIPFIKGVIENGLVVVCKVNDEDIAKVEIILPPGNGEFIGELVAWLAHLQACKGPADSYKGPVHAETVLLMQFLGFADPMRISHFRSFVISVISAIPEIPVPNFVGTLDEFAEHCNTVLGRKAVFIRPSIVHSVTRKTIEFPNCPKLRCDDFAKKNRLKVVGEKRGIVLTERKVKLIDEPLKPGIVPTQYLLDNARKHSHEPAWARSVKGDT